jgi:hypothetical protein
MSDAPPPIDPALQAFADARGRPAVFLFSDSPLWRQYVIDLHKELAGRSFESIDLVIHSGGGIAHSAYQIVELLYLHTKRLNACVPFWAKSAATLLCMGAQEIYVGEHAELGPLDVQIYEEEKAGKGSFSSALNPFKSLEQLVTASVEALAAAMRFIVDEYDMSYEDSLPHAVAFVGVTTGPLVGRLDPVRLGQYNRELAVAIEYGQRLLTRHQGLSPNDATKLAEKLVYGYPSHEYIIDYHELKALGFRVHLFEDEEREAQQGLLALAESEERIVKLVEPAAETTAETTADTDKAKSEATDKEPAGNGRAVKEVSNELLGKRQTKKH